MTTINISENTNWQEVQDVLKSKGSKVVVMSEAELKEHTEKELATKWLMAELAKAEKSLAQGHSTTYTMADLKAGKFKQDVIKRHAANLKKQKS
ncbi:MAG: hypothetical protein FWB72_02105 [Firmicutes bacterium]|nr:hypothetical protein [Bacillota bacterium]